MIKQTKFLTSLLTLMICLFSCTTKKSTPIQESPVANMDTVVQKKGGATEAVKHDTADDTGHEVSEKTNDTEFTLPTAIDTLQFDLFERPYEVCYIKEGALYFYDLKSRSKVRFEEKGEVFSMAFDPKRPWMYYLVQEYEDVYLKRAVFGQGMVTLEWLAALNEKIMHFTTLTYGEKARMKVYQDTLYMEHHYFWLEGFGRCIEHPLRSDTLINADRNTLMNVGTPLYKIYDQWRFITDSIKTQEVKGVKELFYHTSQGQLRLTHTSSFEKQLDQTDDGFGKSFEAILVSPDTTKLIFGLVTGYGDLQHGPHFVVNLDGTGQQKLNEDGLAHLVAPVWLPNGAVLSLDGDPNHQLYMTTGKNNKLSLIDEPVDYFFVRR